MPGPTDLLLEAVNATAVALKTAEVPFALAGGCAVYARGGQRSSNDVDFVIRERDVPVAGNALTAAGLTLFPCPEDWLFKARHESTPVDVIFRLPAGAVDDALLARADPISVGSVVMPVLAANDLVIGKLRALSDHACNLEPVLTAIRSVREQLDHTVVADACAGHPFAEAALYLADRLDILPWREARVRPLDSRDSRDSSERVTARAALEGAAR